MSSPFLRVHLEWSVDLKKKRKLESVTRDRVPFSHSSLLHVSRSSQQNGGPADWAEPRSTYVCKNCSQMFYTEKGLSSHMCFHSDQWPSPRGKQEQQVKGTRRTVCAFRVADRLGGEKDWGPFISGWRCPPSSGEAWGGARSRNCRLEQLFCSPLAVSPKEPSPLL